MITSTKHSLKTFTENAWLQVWRIILLHNWNELRPCMPVISVSLFSESLIMFNVRYIVEHIHSSSCLVYCDWSQYDLEYRGPACVACRNVRCVFNNSSWQLFVLLDENELVSLIPQRVSWRSDGATCHVPVYCTWRHSTHLVSCKIRIIDVILTDGQSARRLTSRLDELIHRRQNEYSIWRIRSTPLASIQLRDHEDSIGPATWHIDWVQAIRQTIETSPSHWCSRAEQQVRAEPSRAGPVQSGLVVRIQVDPVDCRIWLVKDWSVCVCVCVCVCILSSDRR